MVIINESSYKQKDVSYLILYLFYKGRKLMNELDWFSGSMILLLIMFK
jgi:hypothetical protein